MTSLHDDNVTPSVIDNYVQFSNIVGWARENSKTCEGWLFRFVHLASSLAGLDGTTGERLDVTHPGFAPDTF